ncbi:MAG: hypothetical protein H7X89_00560 [Rhizobiales bacterium]|nr:hypothetical protein [Hyphomicrobiales bacterium]
MMKMFHPLALAAVLGAAALAVPASSASAMTISGVQQNVTDSAISGNPLLQEVAKRNSWNERRHGKRYKKRSGSYRHYHNGYYYRTPWWALALPTFGIVVYHDTSYCKRRGYSRHHSWAFNGRKHRCR